MSVSHRFYSNISWNMLGKVGVLFVSLALSVVITRYLGMDQYGVYASILVIPAFVRLLNSLGFETVINKSIPELNVNDPSHKQSRYLLRIIFASRFVCIFFFSMAIYLCLPLYLQVINLPQLISYRIPIVAYFAVTSMNSLYSTLFMTLLRYKIAVFVELFSYLSNLGLLVLFIFMEASITGVMVAYIFSMFLTLVIYIWLSRRDFRGDIEKPDFSGLGQLAGVSWLATIFSFGLLTQSDLFLMNYFHIPMEKVGFYQLTTTAGTMLTFFLTGIQPLALSLFSETFTKDFAEGLKKVWNLIAAFPLFFSLPTYVFVFYDAKKILTLVYGSPFAEAEPVFRLFLLFLILRAITGADFYGVTLYAIKKNNMILRSTIEASVINIILNLVLIPNYAELGALMGTGISILYMGFRRWMIVFKYVSLVDILNTSSKCLLISFIALIPTLVVSYVWSSYLVLDLALYLSAIILLLLKFKPVHKDQILWFENQLPRAAKWIRPFSSLS